jgi:hypothetical protein
MEFAICDDEGREVAHDGVAFWQRAGARTVGSGQLLPGGTDADSGARRLV